MNKRVKNKIQKVVIIYSKRSGNALARFAVEYDPTLTEEEQDAAIDNQIMNSIEWELEDE